MDILTVSDLTDSSLIHGIRGVNGKLILFDYNTVTKYIDDGYNIDKFRMLE